MATKLFDIEDIVKGATYIIVYCAYPMQADCVPVEILRSEFEAWLEGNDKVEWVQDRPDYRNEHDQKTGRYTIEQYWEYVDNDEQRKDLYNFITDRGAAKIFDATKIAIERICKSSDFRNN